MENKMKKLTNLALALTLSSQLLAQNRYSEESKSNYDKKEIPKNYELRLEGNIIRDPCVTHKVLKNEIFMYDNQTGELFAKMVDNDFNGFVDYLKPLEDLSKEPVPERISLVKCKEDSLQISKEEDFTFIPGSKKGNALIVLAHPRTYDGAFKDIQENINKIKERYNLFIDTIETKKEFFEAHEKAVKNLGGKLDLYVGFAHGSPESIALGDNGSGSSDNFLLSSDFLIYPSLEKYYNENARGLQISCSVADTSYKNNFAQNFSNSAKIPIEGLNISGSVYINTNLNLESIIIRVLGRKSGFSDKGEGTFESSNGIQYDLTNKRGLIEVKAMYFNDTTLNPKTWDLPKDFDESKVYHSPLKSLITKVYPK